MRYLHKMGKPDINNPTRLKNIGVSDLWFNWDHSNEATYEDGSFAGYDIPRMLIDAEGFICALKYAGVQDIPEPYQLVEDLHARL